MRKVYSLKKDLDRIKKMGWIPCNNHYGDAGNKLEELLNRNPSNFEIPDYDGIEIKTKKSLLYSNITLFSATPDSYLFEIKRIHKLYGYPDRKNRDFKILNNSVYCNNLTYIYNGIYFTLKIDRMNNKVKLLVCNSNMDVIDDLTSWSFNMLKEKLERKLRYLCFVEVDKILFQNQLYIKYVNDSYYLLKGFETFINLIETGFISITFRISVFKSGKRKGQIHDHGTSLSISKENLDLLFDKLL